MLTRFTISLHTEVIEANANPQELQLHRVSENDPRVDVHQLWITQPGNRDRQSESPDIHKVCINLCRLHRGPTDNPTRGCFGSSSEAGDC